MTTVDQEIFAVSTGHENSLMYTNLHVYGKVVNHKIWLKQNIFGIKYSWTAHQISDHFVVSPSLWLYGCVFVANSIWWYCLSDSKVGTCMIDRVVQYWNPWYEPLKLLSLCCAVYTWWHCLIETVTVWVIYKAQSVAGWLAWPCKEKH